MVKKILSIIALIVVIPCIILGIFLAYMTITDYNPEAIIPLTVNHPIHHKLNPGEMFSVTTFNIGYAGLDKQEDFFMDGGNNSHVRNKEQALKNIEAISKVLTQEKSSFYLLQEVDVDSSRSFHMNQIHKLHEKLPHYSLTYAQNYLVQWVPVPVLDPMGSTNSGLVTFSKYQVNRSTRYALYGKEDWPQQIFDLDRCIMENRIPLKNGKELILVNVHLSAYDKGGKVRKKQLSFLKKYMHREYTSGNYLILGGDWNHLIPGTNPKLFKTTEKWPSWLQVIPHDFTLPGGFQWVADAHVPSSRTLAIPYKKGVNFTSNIDGFLVSPNIKVEKVQGHSLEFEHSDHNPVTAHFQLK